MYVALKGGALPAVPRTLHNARADGRPNAPVLLALQLPSQGLRSAATAPSNSSTARAGHGGWRWAAQHPRKRPAATAGTAAVLVTMRTVRYVCVYLCMQRAGTCASVITLARTRQHDWQKPTAPIQLKLGGQPSPAWDLLLSAASKRLGRVLCGYNPSRRPSDALVPPARWQARQAARRTVLHAVRRGTQRR